MIAFVKMIKREYGNNKTDNNKYPWLWSALPVLVAVKVYMGYTRFKSEKHVDAEKADHDPADQNNIK